MHIHLFLRTARPNVRVAGLLCALVGLTPLSAAGQANVPSQPNLVRGTTAPAVPRPAEPAPGDYVIGADDLLSVVFWRDQQLSGDVLVRPDGKISVPLLDDIQAAGLTPLQLRDRLLLEARRFLNEAIVTVVVKQTNSRKVFITGRVLRPGQYPLGTDMTILQLIAIAGGLQDYAKANQIRVVRSERGQTVSVPFDYDEMSKAKADKARNLTLKPGDTVIVP
jgi:polysaccharide export outer membrane protein